MYGEALPTWLSMKQGPWPTPRWFYLSHRKLLKASCRPWTRWCNDATTLAGYATMRWCLHCTGGYTTGCTTSCMNTAGFGAFDRNLKKKIFLFVFTVGSIWSRGMTKIRSITKLYKTLLCLFIYLLYKYSKRFFQPVIGPQPAAKCKQTLMIMTTMMAAVGDGDFRGMSERGGQMSRTGRAAGHSS